MPAGTAFLASPLLSPLPEHVLLHFQLAPDGTVSSPQVVAPGLREALGAVMPASGGAALDARLRD